MSNLKSSQPIGVFDSGIGGLTVANAINSLLPNEQLIYFGDTAHMPYGDKSPEAIKYYSIKIGQFLLEQNCKAIVIACNTASSLGFDNLNQVLKGKIPVINVIDPTVEYILNHKKIKHVGVIGTKATIKSNVYAKKIKEKNEDLLVESLATPLLAPMIEEGFFNNNISKTIINSYLEKPKLRKVDSLVLACTHYPLIKKEILEFYKREINILDSAEIVAQYVKKVLAKKKLLSTKKLGNHHFYVSDFTSSFEKSTKIFFKEKIHLELKNIWA
jgi:glutamate racemase